MFITACSSLTGGRPGRWFRGQSNAAWPLTPSALRFTHEKDRTAALEKLHEFKRLAVMKLPKPPGPDRELEWVQVARHYGLPTRLLDWTENAAIGLYFACRNTAQDGLVFVLDPIALNVAADTSVARVLDANKDAKVINKYLALGGRIQTRGRPSVAINPVWNSERLILQKGAFTLHGSRDVAITHAQVESLIALPVLEEDKPGLLQELALIGVDEMSIFPEPEHVCDFLVQDLRN